MVRDVAITCGPRGHSTLRAPSSRLLRLLSWAVISPLLVLSIIIGVPSFASAVIPPDCVNTVYTASQTITIDPADSSYTLRLEGCEYRGGLVLTAINSNPLTDVRIVAKGIAAATLSLSALNISWGSRIEFVGLSTTAAGGVTATVSGGGNAVLRFEDFGAAAGGSITLGPSTFAGGSRVELDAVRVGSIAVATAFYSGSALIMRGLYVSASSTGVSVTGAFIDSLMHVDGSLLVTTGHHNVLITQPLQSGSIHRFTNTTFDNRHLSGEVKGLLYHSGGVKTGALLHVSGNQFSAIMGQANTLYAPSYGGLIIHDGLNRCETPGQLRILIDEPGPGHLIHLDGYAQFTAITIAQGPKVATSGHSFIFNNSRLSGALTIAFGTDTNTTILIANVSSSAVSVGGGGSCAGCDLRMIGVDISTTLTLSATRVSTNVTLDGATVRGTSMIAGSFNNGSLLHVSRSTFAPVEVSASFTTSVFWLEDSSIPVTSQADALTITGSFFESLLHMEGCGLMSAGHHNVLITQPLQSGSVHRFTNNTFDNRHLSGSVKGLLYHSGGVKAGALLHVSGNRFSAIMGQANTLYATSYGGLIIHDGLNRCETPGQLRILIDEPGPGHLIHLDGYAQFTAITIAQGPKVATSGHSFIFNNSRLSGALTIAFGTDTNTTILIANVSSSAVSVGGGGSCAGCDLRMIGVDISTTLTLSATRVSTSVSLCAVSVKGSTSIEGSFVANSTLYISGSTFALVTVSSSFTAASFFLFGSSITVAQANALTISGVFNASLLHVGGCTATAAGHIVVSVTQHLDAGSVHRFTSNTIDNRHLSGSVKGLLYYSGSIAEGALLYVSNNTFITIMGAAKTLYAESAGGRIIHDGLNRCDSAAGVWVIVGARQPQSSASASTTGEGHVIHINGYSKLNAVTITQTAEAESSRFHSYMISNSTVTGPITVGFGSDYSFVLENASVSSAVTLTAAQPLGSGGQIMIRNATLKAALAITASPESRVYLRNATVVGAVTLSAASAVAYLGIHARVEGCSFGGPLTVTMARGNRSSCVVEDSQIGTAVTLKGSLVASSWFAVRQSRAQIVTIEAAANCDGEGDIEARGDGGCFVEVSNNTLSGPSYGISMPSAGSIGNRSQLVITGNRIAPTGSAHSIYFASANALAGSSVTLIAANDITTRSTAVDGLHFAAALASLLGDGLLEVWGNTVRNGGMRIRLGANALKVTIVDNAIVAGGAALVVAGGSGSAAEGVTYRVAACNTVGGAAVDSSSFVALGFADVGCGEASSVKRCVGMPSEQTVAVGGGFAAEGEQIDHCIIFAGGDAIDAIVSSSISLLSLSMLSSSAVQFLRDAYSSIAVDDGRECAVPDTVLFQHLHEIVDHPFYPFITLPPMTTSATTEADAATIATTTAGGAGSPSAEGTISGITVTSADDGATSFDASTAAPLPSAPHTSSPPSSDTSSDDGVPSAIGNLSTATVDSVTALATTTILTTAAQLNPDGPIVEGPTSTATAEDGGSATAATAPPVSGANSSTRPPPSFVAEDGTVCPVAPITILHPNDDGSGGRVDITVKESDVRDGFTRGLSLASSSFVLGDGEVPHALIGVHVSHRGLGNTEGFRASIPANITLRIVAAHLLNGTSSSSSVAVSESNGTTAAAVLTLSALPSYTIYEDEGLDLYVISSGGPSSLPYQSASQCSTLHYVRIGTITVTASSAEALAAASDGSMGVSVAATAASGVFASLLGGTGGSAAEQQGLSAMAMMSCADPHTRAAFGSYRALSPFALSNSYIGVIGGNLTVHGVVLVLQWCVVLYYRFINTKKKRGAIGNKTKGASADGAQKKKSASPTSDDDKLVAWRDAFFKARFPGFLLGVIFALHCGTAYAASQLVSLSDVPAGERAVGVIVFVGVVLCPFFLSGIAYRYIVRSFNSYNVPEWLVLRGLSPNSLLRHAIPEGVILPPETRRIWGSYISSYRLPHSCWPSYPAWTPLIYAVGGLFHPETLRGCQALFACMGIAYVVCALIIFSYLPKRSLLHNAKDGAARCLSAAALFAMAVALEPSAMGVEGAEAVVIIGYTQTAVTIFGILFMFWTARMDASLFKLPVRTLWVHYAGMPDRTAKTFITASEDASTDAALLLLGARAGEADDHDAFSDDDDVSMGLISKGGDGPLDAKGQRGEGLPLLVFDSTDSDGRGCVGRSAGIPPPIGANRSSSDVASSLDDDRAQQQQEDSVIADALEDDLL